MTRDASISRSVLSDQVKDRLLQAILDGRYPPGARIVETRVARELGTSQAPVREALRDLEALGVVETTAFRGARVRRPSAAELLEAFAIRAELESLGARLAIPRLADADLATLEGYIEEMQRAAEAGDTHDEAAADAAFHSRIVELAGNRTLARVWRTLEPYSRTYITIDAPGIDRRRIADEHLPVLDALRRRDPDLVVEVLHRHFATAAAMLASLWERTDAAGSRPASGSGPAVRRPASRRVPRAIPSLVEPPA
ncbi:MAG: GntR family transcriptional regulator [Chloroflexi bacterium]|nr:GntR family transcriptional regulator [Chloroflexota bacterium]